MKENLRETVSLWQDLHEPKHYQTLKTDLQTDVCIIGAGISGLSAAYHLGENGKKVVVIDDGDIAGGQTCRTTGHLSNALDDRYYNLERDFGEEGAKLAAKAHSYSIHFVAEFVKKHHVKCHFGWVDAYLFEPPGKTSENLLKERDAAMRAGIEGVEIVERAPITSFDTGKALRFPGQAEFSPLSFIDSFCKNINGSIYTSVHACDIDKQKNGYRVITDRRCEIIAKHVVIATNSPTFSRFLPHLKQAPYTTYVITGKIKKGIVTPALYYDTPDPYHYIRVFPADEMHDYLIIGGEDHRAGEKKEIQLIYDRLEQWARERFPDMLKKSHRWSGQIIEPVDSLGFIGRIHDEMYMITGDSGNGLTNGIFGGYLINELIHKRKTPFEKLFDPHRKTLKETADFLKENLNTASQYRDWLTPGESKKMPLNSGAVVRCGLKKCALFRDEKGKVHKMSAICPHLGAVVRWNQIEHCWECPAHGSRFSAEGKVLQGPANCDLTKDLSDNDSP